MLGFSDDMRRRGFTPSHETLFAGRVRASAEVAEALGVKVNSSIYQSRRLLKADGTPIGFAVSWLSPKFLQDKPPPSIRTLNEGSLYEWLHREFGAKVVRASEYIEAAVVQAEMAGHLHVAPGAPVLIIRRSSFVEDPQPIEYVILYFRADRYRFQLRIGRNCLRQLLFEVFAKLKPPEDSKGDECSQQTNCKGRIGPVCRRLYRCRTS